MNINFTCRDKLISEIFPPKPAAEAVPDWFKELPVVLPDNARELPLFNIKSCPPATDFLTGGYIIFNSYEFTVKQKLENFRESLVIKTPKKDYVEPPGNGYVPNQCPVKIQGKYKSYFQFELEWKIKTPPGYSCLIMQPYYQFESQYSLMPAIIDTDSFDSVLQVVGYLNTGVSEVDIKPGDPILQVIPFKRDVWNMNVTHDKVSTKINHFLHGAYRKLFHSKKEFK
jgi:hypothetical protein